MKEETQLAWDHFKFHAEQRTRMLNFFLITIGLLVSAASIIFGKDSIVDPAVGVVILSFGGILSTLFFALDVRNTQLLEYSEALLRIIEKDMYPRPKWVEETDAGEIKLGLLSRELVLKTWIKEQSKTEYKTNWSRLVRFNNIKHKTCIRAIMGLSAFAFWMFALYLSAAIDSVSFIPLGIVFLGCAFFVYQASVTPDRDLKDEAKAFEWWKVSGKE